MLAKTAISCILINSLLFAGAGSIDASPKSVESSSSVHNSTLNRVSFEDDSDILLYIDPSTGAYLGESAGTKVETRAAPVIAWIGAMAVRLSAYAISRMAARGISQALVKQAITQGIRSNANKGAWKYVMGKGKNKITVMVSKSTGKVITVTKG